MRAWRAATRWLQVNPASRVGGSIAAVFLGVSGLFGGLDRTPLSDRVGEVQPGAEVVVQPFALTLKRAIAADELADVARPLTPGNHLMVVQLTAENVTDRSLGSHFLMPVSREKPYLNRNLVVLDDRLAPDAPTVYDSESNLAVSRLSPGLTYDLALVWEFGGPVPEWLHLGLSALTLRGETISPDVLSWQDPDEAGTVSLAVHDNTREQP